MPAHALDRAPNHRVTMHLAEVVSVKDPDSRGRIQVRLYDHDNVTQQDAPIWARVAVPFAGSSRGMYFIPDKGDEVLVSFINGDPRMPIVCGGLWNGGATPPDSFGGDGESVDRWVIKSKAGTTISIKEESSGNPKVEITTPGGQSYTISDESSGKITLSTATGNTVTMDTSGVSIQTSNKVSVQASQVEVTSGQVTVNAGLSQFSGVVKANVVQADTIIGTTYTPGAGNVW